MNIFNLFKSNKNDGDFLQVSEAYKEPRFTQEEITKAMIKASHAIELPSGKVIGIKRLFKPKR